MCRNGTKERWEFTGKPPLVAAKTYLRLVGEPRPFDDIVAAIRKHGGDPGSIEHLKTALSRSTLDIVKVPGEDDIYGLLEFFPHIKRQGKRKKGAVAAVDVEADEDESTGVDEVETEGEIGNSEPEEREGGEA